MLLPDFRTALALIQPLAIVLKLKRYLWTVVESALFVLRDLHQVMKTWRDCMTHSSFS